MVIKKVEQKISQRSHMQCPRDSGFELYGYFKQKHNNTNVN